MRGSQAMSKLVETQMLRPEQFHQVMARGNLTSDDGLAFWYNSLWIQPTCHFEDARVMFRIVYRVQGLFEEPRSPRQQDRPLIDRVPPHFPTLFLSGTFLLTARDTTSNLIGDSLISPIDEVSLL